MEKANMKTFIGGLILLYSDTIKSLETVQEVAKKFDGKVINRRFYEAVWNATKGASVSICVSKDPRCGWVYRAVLYTGAAWKVYGDAVYFGYQASGEFPGECFKQAAGKAPRINANAMIAYLEKEIDSLDNRIIRIDDYVDTWAAEVEKYNRLCDETYEIVKKLPCELVDYIRRGKVGVRFKNPWRFD